MKSLRPLTRVVANKTIEIPRLRFSAFIRYIFIDVEICRKTLSLFPVLFALATHTFQRKQCAESQQEQSSEQQQCTPALRFWELQETLCRMPPHSLHQPGTGLVSWDNCSMMRSCKYLNGAQTLIRLKMGAKQGKPKRKCVNKARPWPQVIQSTHRFKAISNDGGTRGLQLGGCSRNGFVLRMLGWWKQTQAATMVVIVMQLSSRCTGPLLLLTPPPPTH